MMDRLLRNNTIVKIIAAFLAIMLWLTVHADPNTGGGTGSSLNQMTRQLHDKAVKVLYDQHNYTLVGGAPTVTLTLHGSVIDVTNAAAFGDSIQVIADATGLGEGTHSVRVYTQGVPPGVTVDDANVTIQLEANINREYPIKLITEGKPKTGFNVGAAQVSPKTVIVTGAKSVLDTISQVVATVPLDSATDAIYTSVPITAIDKNGKPVKNVFLSHEQAEVSIPISVPSKQVSLRLQFKGSVAPGFAVSGVTPSTVTVTGTSDALSQIDSYPAPVIDLTGLTKTTKFTLQLQKSDGVTDVQPQQVDVEVQVAQAVQQSFSAVPIKITGLKTGQSAVFAAGTGTVDVTVSGAKTLLDTLTTQDINAYVDLSNQPAGQQMVNVQVDVPNFLTVSAISPQTVSMTVNK